MEMTSATYTIWLRELKRYIRNRPRIIASIMMPVMWFGIMGVGLSASFKIPNVSYDYLNFLSPGIIGQSILFSSIFSAISVIWDKQFGFMKEMLVAPISRTSIVLGKILGSATIAVFTAVVILLLAIIFDGVPLENLNPVSVATILGLMFLLSVSFVSIGLVIASKMNSMEGFQVVMTTLVLPLFFLSGAFFPLQNAPTWMQVLSNADPLTYGVDGLRGSLLGIYEKSLLLDYSVLIGFSLFMIAVATFMFKRIQ